MGHDCQQQASAFRNHTVCEPGLCLLSIYYLCLEAASSGADMRIPELESTTQSQEGRKGEGADQRMLSKSESLRAGLGL